VWGRVISVRPEKFAATVVTEANLYFYLSTRYKPVADVQMGDFVDFVPGAPLKEKNGLVGTRNPRAEHAQIIARGYRPEQQNTPGK
jgi:hypothetical protein